ncbi:MAG TPA: GIY-YIG nuclease family protein [Candidatus Andersenbacteria bacterium]|nr:GIY-YIG nuclease family protein [Candidatus Andersenbacteria bacterium]
MYFVYILKLSDDTLYIGSASNLQKRLIDHKQGIVSSTKNHRPVHVKWFCSFPEKIKAMQFEKYLKSGSGFSWRKRHLGF